MQSYHEKRTVSPVKIRYLKTYLHGNNVLDVGAGAGNYSQWIAQNYLSSRVHALDLHKIPDIKNVQCFEYDLEKKLLFNDESFQTIIAFDVIEHIRNENQLLAELFRVGTSSSVFIGSVPHDDDRFLPGYNLTFKHRQDLTHLRNYTSQSLKDVLHNAGFDQIQIFGEGGVSPQVFAEFFPHFLHWPIKKMIGFFRRLRLINTKKINSDLFFIARKN